MLIKYLIMYLFFIYFICVPASKHHLLHYIVTNCSMASDVSFFKLVTLK